MNKIILLLIALSLFAFSVFAEESQVTTSLTYLDEYDSNIGGVDVEVEIVELPKSGGGGASVVVEVPADPKEEFNYVVFFINLIIGLIFILAGILFSNKKDDFISLVLTYGLGILGFSFVITTIIVHIHGYDINYINLDIIFILATLLAIGTKLQYLIEIIKHKVNYDD